MNKTLKIALTLAGVVVLARVVLKKNSNQMKLSIPQDFLSTIRDISLAEQEMFQEQ